jgi:hypothetical protein
MRHRVLSLAVLALVVAACNPAAELEPPQEVELSYSLEPGSSYTYEVTLDQTFDVTTTGDAAALAEQDVPGEMSVRMVGTSVFTHSVADGPEPGTYAVTITGDFSDMEFSGTVDGEPVDPAEIPELAEIEPVDVTVIVDEQGNVIPDANGGLEGLPGGDDLGSLGGLGDMAQGFDLGRFVGPPLEEGEVGVGDSWSRSIEIPDLMGEGSAGSSEIESTITGTETLNGVEVFVIDTTVTVPEVTFDLAEIMLGMFEAFIPEDATAEDLAEFEQLEQNLRMSFSLEPSVTSATTLFDPESGMAMKSDYSGEQQLSMDMNVPDEATGEMIEFGVSMTIAQTIGYDLVEA